MIWGKARINKWESLGNGETLIIKGDCAYDKYERDYVIYPYDVLKVSRKKRMDDAERKTCRVCICILKWLDMDGFCDTKQAVKTAHRMGHRAIAITDHGVAQGFPMQCLPRTTFIKRPDFKLIYGVEAYFVDDMIPIVYGAHKGFDDAVFCCV